MAERDHVRIIPCQSSNVWQHGLCYDVDAEISHYYRVWADRSNVDKGSDLLHSARFLSQIERLLYMDDMHQFVPVCSMAQVQMLMDLVCSSCGELMEDAVKKNMRIRVLASDVTRVRTVVDVFFIVLLFSRPHDAYR